MGKDGGCDDRAWHRWLVKGGQMYDEAELRSMSPQQRAGLARVLASLDAADHALGPPSHWRRLLVTAAAIACAVILAFWIGWLAISLPRHFRADGWQAAWIGFDVVLLLVFLVTAWAAWRQRQVLIACLIVLATLLCCDAWFDITLDWSSRGLLVSVLLAVLVELPLAVAALIGARRLIRLTISRVAALEGRRGPVIAFWRVPLLGGAQVSYRDLLRQQPPRDALAGTGGTEAGPVAAGAGAGVGAAGAGAGIGAAGIGAGTAAVDAGSTAAGAGAGSTAAAGTGAGAGTVCVGAGTGPASAGADALSAAAASGTGAGPAGPATPGAAWTGHPAHRPAAADAE